MIEQAIADYLEDFDIECNINFQPDTDDLVSTIYSESAPVADYQSHFNSDNIGIQFLTRSRNHNQAQERAWAIHQLISGMGFVLLNDIWFVDTVTVNTPSFLGLDEKNRAEFTQHYIFTVNIGGNRYRQDTETLNPVFYVMKFDDTFDNTFR